MSRSTILPLPLLAIVLVTPQLIAQTVPAPTARISTPGAGVVDAELVVPFEATVTPATIQTAMLTVNGASYEVPVSGGAGATAGDRRARQQPRRHHRLGGRARLAQRLTTTRNSS